LPKRFVYVALCVLNAAALAAGCAKARAQTVPDGPPLAVPAPPSRVFAPIEDEEPLASSPVAPETPVTRPPNVNTQARPPAPRPRPETEPAAAAPAPAPAPSPENPRELRAASSPADPEAERKIGEQLKRASATLGNVYYQGLTPQRRELYELAKAFIADGEKAMKEHNFINAETLADKAAKLATELLGR